MVLSALPDAAAEILTGSLDSFQPPICLLGDMALSVEISDSISRMSGGKGAFLPLFVSYDSFLESVAASCDTALDFRSVAKLASEWRSSRWGHVASDTALQILLYGLLEERNYFMSARRFPVMREIISLFKEMESEGIQLPETLDGFERLLGEEKDRRALGALAQEAQVVITLWHCHMQTSVSLKSRIKGLNRLRGSANVPFVVVDGGQMPRCLSDFVNEVAGRCEVHVLEPCFGRVGKVLLDCWDSDGSVDKDGLSGHFDSMRMVEGADFEMAAHAVIGEIRKHSIEGRKRIGVVLFDRVLARRTQALAGGEGILIDDKSGWVSSTLLVGSMLLLYCDLVNKDASMGHLADFIMSPGVFYDFDQAEVERGVQEAAKILHSHGRKASLPDLDKVDSLVLKDIISEIAGSPMGKSGPHRLHKWISLLLEATGTRALKGVFRGDAPALEIVQMLSSHLRPLADEPIILDYQQFRSWLHDLLEENFIAPADNESEVSFVSLRQAWMRRYDALVMLGPSTGTLPATTEFVFFNSSLRMQLGLKGDADLIAEQKRMVAMLLERHEHVSVVWSRTGHDGQNFQQSPLFDILGSALDVSPHLFNQLPVRAGAGKLKFPPERAFETLVSLPQHLFPPRFSVSSYETLMSCPFLYFGEKLLGLCEREEGEGSDRRDFGYRVHTILQHFADEVLAKRENLSWEDLMSAIESIAVEEFGKVKGMKGEIGLAQFKRFVGSLCSFEKSRHEKGWMFDRAEYEIKSDRISLGSGAMVSLVGKIDRIDRKTRDGREVYSVIDYKTLARERLKEMVSRADGESPQVALYAHLLQLEENLEIEDCLYVHLRDKDEKVEYSIGADRAYASDLYDRLVELIRQMERGTPLPANGRERRCGNCHMAGLCRKPLWSVEGGS